MSKKMLAAQLLKTSGCRSLLQRLPTWSGLLVLNYHRIGDGSTSLFDRALWSARAEEFDAQIRFLKMNCELIGPYDLPGVLEKRRGRHVLLTFDDGYRDNYDQAFPILQARGVQALFFVTVGFLDDGRVSWWDEIAWMVRRATVSRLSPSPLLPRSVAFDEPHRERAIHSLVTRYKELPGTRTSDFLTYLAEATGSGRYPFRQLESEWMSWDMVRAMRDAGMGIGGHTVSHPILSRLPARQQQEEIIGCAQRLQQELQEQMRWFSYPVGDPDFITGEARTCLEQIGVHYAFSHYGGYSSFDELDPYDLRREPIGPGISLPLFQAMVTVPPAFCRSRSRVHRQAGRRMNG